MDPAPGKSSGHPRPTPTSSSDSQTNANGSPTRQRPPLDSTATRTHPNRRVPTVDPPTGRPHAPPRDAGRRAAGQTLVDRRSLRQSEKRRNPGVCDGRIAILTLDGRRDVAGLWIFRAVRDQQNEGLSTTSRPRPRRLRVSGARLDLRDDVVRAVEELLFTVVNRGRRQLLAGVGYGFERHTAFVWRPQHIARAFVAVGLPISPGERTREMPAEVPERFRPSRYRLSWGLRT
jgi:hypothetical protein